MLLEIKRCTLPHLKGLDSHMERSTRGGHGSNSIDPKLSKKVLILLHSEANVWFLSLFAVYVQIRIRLLSGKLWSFTLSNEIFLKTKNAKFWQRKYSALSH